jgi:Sulfotransferase family
MSPDFIIIGAPKAGTTWLYRNLSTHPGVFLTANKEPRYYSVEEGAEISFCGPGDTTWMSHFVRSKDEYEDLFAGACDGQLRGEASSDYLYRSSVAARRLRREAPDARIVVLLRDPVHRAYSNWLHHMRDARETLPFRAAMEAEPMRIEFGWAWWWHYAGRGFYARQLAPFLEHFPEEQLLFLSYDELRRDPLALLGRVCSFLDLALVADGTVAERRNESFVPRSPAHRAAHGVLKPNAVSRAVLPQRLRTALRHRVNRATLYRPRISAEDYRRFRFAFAADTRRLNGMIGLDVSGWLA